MAWKVRTAGDRVKWYKEVDEVKVRSGTIG